MKKLFLALCLILFSTVCFAEEENVIYNKEYTYKKRTETLNLVEKSINDKLSDTLYVITDDSETNTIKCYVVTSDNDQLVKLFLVQLEEKRTAGIVGLYFDECINRVLNEDLVFFNSINTRLKIKQTNTKVDIVDNKITKTIYLFLD